MRCDEIEVAVSRYFDYRRNVIVPNLSWGLPALGHECDLLVISSSMYCTEVEIKTSGSDIRADMKKGYQGRRADGSWYHWGPLVRKCWFAVPENLENHECIPAYCGVLGVRRRGLRTEVHVVRPPHVNKLARPLTVKELAQVGRLAAMRIWDLKALRLPAGETLPSDNTPQGIPDWRSGQQTFDTYAQRELGDYSWRSSGC